MVNRYQYIRVYKESAEALKKRLEQINTRDLKRIGVKKRVPQIEFTNFLFKNVIYISDLELKRMAVKRWRGAIC